MTARPLPWRLPPGWSVFEGLPDGVDAALGPQRLGRPDAGPRLAAAPWPEAAGQGLAAAARGVVAGIAREPQLLDEGRVAMHDGRPAHRTLYACREPDGLPLTVDARVTGGPGGIPLLLVASAPTPLWPLLGARLGRLLTSTGRVEAAPAPGPVEPLVAASPDGPLWVRLDGDVYELERVDGHVLWDGEPLHTGLLPHWLAAAFGLGPRPPTNAPPGLLLAPRTDLERCLGGEPGDLVAPNGPWQLAVQRLAGARRLGVAGATGTVEVLDAGDAGLWRVLEGADDDPAIVGLRAADPSAAWAALIRACAA